MVVRTEENQLLICSVPDSKTDLVCIYRLQLFFVRRSRCPVSLTACAQEICVECLQQRSLRTALKRQELSLNMLFIPALQTGKRVLVWQNQRLSIQRKLVY